MKQIIESITQEEWQQFQNVNNQGGRASCQDDYAQFHIMRSSQFSVWPDELLSSYYDDLVRARDEGQNLVFNKYAYMMERQTPSDMKNSSMFYRLYQKKEERILSQLYRYMLNGLKSLLKNIRIMHPKGGSYTEVMRFAE